MTPSEVQRATLMLRVSHYLVPLAVAAERGKASLAMLHEALALAGTHVEYAAEIGDDAWLAAAVSVRRQLLRFR